MSRSWTNSLAAAGLLALAGGAFAEAAAQERAAQEGAEARTFACPEGMGYRFSYTDPDFGGGESGGWEAGIKRAEGASAAGLPELSARSGAMRCRYRLPNGAFMLLARPFPEGTECSVRQDGYFDPAYFGCE